MGKILLVLSTLILNMNLASAKETVIKNYIMVEKNVLTSEEDRYVFSLCQENIGCSTLGQEHGYSLKAIRGFDGRIQQYVGAPALILTEATVGVFAAFVIGSVAVPAATSGAAAAILWGGFGAGATLPSIGISSDSFMRGLSPAQQWRAGSVKVNLEKNVRALAKLPSDETERQTAFIYVAKDRSELDALFEKADMVDRILRNL